MKGTEQERPSQPRKTPIDLQEEVRRRAYQIYVERGMLKGFELEDWLKAEAEVLNNERMTQVRLNRLSLVDRPKRGKTA